MRHFIKSACRHEVPVADSRIRVIRMTEDLVVVDKPASIPVHPCGRYRFILLSTCWPVLASYWSMLHCH